MFITKAFRNIPKGEKNIHCVCMHTHIDVQRHIQYVWQVSHISLSLPLSPCLYVYVSEIWLGNSWLLLQQPDKKSLSFSKLHWLSVLRESCLTFKWRESEREREQSLSLSLSLIDPIQFNSVSLIGTALPKHIVELWNTSNIEIMWLKLTHSFSPPSLPQLLSSSDCCPCGPG